MSHKRVKDISYSTASSKLRMYYIRILNTMKSYREITDFFILYLKVIQKFGDNLEPESKNYFKNSRYVFKK